MKYTITDKNEIKKALVEVKVIINKLSRENYLKIPDNIISYIEKNMDNDYVYEYDEKKELGEQTLNRYTLPILAYINMEFLLNKKQRVFMKNVYDENDKRLEKELHKKYNPNDIFKKKNNF